MSTAWLPDGWWSGAEHLPSPNFGERPVEARISLVVIHNISLPPDEFGGNWVEDFFLNRLDPTAHPYFATIADVQVSAHFYLRRDGRVIQFVGADKRAWHAGRSCWQGRENCNDWSIGIELEGCDTQVFTTAQYAALCELLAALPLRYPISALAGHSDIAPGRKTDPGPGFDWQTIARRFPEFELPLRDIA